MGNAFRSGLAGGLMGLMSGAHQQWQETQHEFRTERARRAKQLESEALARIAAEHESAKDAREHGQAIELEGIKAQGKAALEADKEAGRNERARLSRESADARAARTGSTASAKPQVLVPISGQGESVAWTPGTPIPPGYTVTADPRFRSRDDERSGFDKLQNDARSRVLKMADAELDYELEQRSILPTDRASDRRALADALTVEANELYGFRSSPAPSQRTNAGAPAGLPAGAVAAGRAPNGVIVYRLADGSLVTAE